MVQKGFFLYPLNRTTLRNVILFSKQRLEPLGFLKFLITDKIQWVVETGFGTFFSALLYIKETGYM